MARSEPPSARARSDGCAPTA